MVGNINLLDLEFEVIPKKWVLKPKEANYDMLTLEVHYQHGWRQIVLENYDTITQKLGKNYYDKDKDVISKIILNKTQEEIRADKMAGAEVITQLQGLLLLDQMGLSDTVKNMLIASEHNASQIYFEYSPTWERNSPIIGRMANLLGMSEDQLDDFFITASKLV